MDVLTSAALDMVPLAILVAIIYDARTVTPERAKEKSTGAIVVAVLIFGFAIARDVLT